MLTIVLVTYGNSPLIMSGLDPEIRYSVTIDVFNGNHMVLTDQTVTQEITVMGGKIFFHA